MTVRILCIGLGGLGVISSYTLLRNDNVEITAVIRSDYDVVQKDGYTIDSVDYKEKLGIISYKPKHVVKSLSELPENPFDYIIVATKVIPKQSNNIWDEVEQYQKNLINENTCIVLLQNGINIEKYWKYPNLISGVSYISSTNDKGTITQYGTDNVRFGFFDKSDKQDKLDQFIQLYSNEFNKAEIDTNVKLSRWKKLLYNSSYNTICCLVDLDIGRLYQQEDFAIPNLITPLMKEIQLVGNLDLLENGSDTLITDENINTMETLTKKFDRPTNYQPSMLVDYRNDRPIELEIIVGNVIRIYEGLHGDLAKIPNLNFLYSLLKLVQFRVELKNKGEK